MRLLPYDRFTIVTHLDAETVRQRLADDIEPTRWFRFFGPHRSFQGTISESSFKIERIYGESNRPFVVFCGRIVQIKQHTEISVLVRPHGGVMIWFFLWITMSWVAILGSVRDAVVEGGKLTNALFFVVPTLFIFLVPWFVFQSVMAGEIYKGRAALEWALREPRLPKGNS